MIMQRCGSLELHASLLWKQGYLKLLWFQGEKNTTKKKTLKNSTEPVRRSALEHASTVAGASLSCIDVKLLREQNCGVSGADETS